MENLHLPPLHQAACIGDLERVRQLAAEGVSLNGRDSQERTPLHWAALFNELEIAEFLVDSCHSCTPVMIAASCEKQSNMEPILERESNEGNILLQSHMNSRANIAHQSSNTDKVDINAVDVGGNTPLLLAMFGMHKDIIALLIRAGADVNHRYNESKTALHWASFDELDDISGGALTEMVQMLLEVWLLQVNPQDEYGDTPLHLACRMGRQLLAVGLLLEAGADPNLKNCAGKTALHVALEQRPRDTEGIELLVKKGGFLDAFGYEQVFPDVVLQNVDLCTQMVVNRYHLQSLPALRGIPRLRLPCVNQFKLTAKHINDVKMCVERDIQANSFCNVVMLRPMVLSMMCVEAFLASQQGSPV